MISLITLCHSHVRSEKLVDSPLLKEIEYKKAMLNRKPSQNKTILVRKKPNRMLKPIYQPRLSPETGSLEKGKLSYLEGNTTQAKSESRKSNLKETPASDRMFLPPYKYPLWGMPYGIYSNGGFVNPGLFPFVPGGMSNRFMIFQNVIVVVQNVNRVIAYYFALNLRPRFSTL